MTQVIVVEGIQIRCDHDGRFCLNDLHRASGGEKRHQPSNWLALQQTQALIGAIARSAQNEPGTPVAPVVSRQGLGTFGVKSLVYAYAMWISPEFHLRVIDAYDAMQMAMLNERRNAVQLPNFNDPVAAARAWADEAEKVRQLAHLAREQSAHIEATRPAVEFHAAVAASNDSITIGQFAKLMGVGEIRLFNFLRREKILITGGARHNLPYQKHIDVGRFKVNESTYTDSDGRVHLKFQTRITPKGQLWLQQTYFPNSVNALAATPDMFAPQLPHISEVIPVEAPPAIAEPAPGMTPMVDVEREIAQLRALRRQLLASRSTAPRTAQVMPLPMRRMMNDDLGDLAHPDQEHEAALARYRPS